MVIDCHGHYTTAPKELQVFRDAQIAALTDPSTVVPRLLDISDDQLRDSVRPQLTFQTDRGTDVTIFSPRASAMKQEKSWLWLKIGERAVRVITQPIWCEI